MIYLEEFFGNKTNLFTFRFSILYVNLNNVKIDKLAVLDSGWESKSYVTCTECYKRRRLKRLNWKLTVQTSADSWWILISQQLFLANATIASFPANVPCAPNSFTEYIVNVIKFNCFEFVYKKLLKPWKCWSTKGKIGYNSKIKNKIH